MGGRSADAGRFPFKRSCSPRTRSGRERPLLALPSLPRRALFTQGYRCVFTVVRAVRSGPRTGPDRPGRRDLPLSRDMRTADAFPLRRFGMACCKQGCRPVASRPSSVADDPALRAAARSPFAVDACGRFRGLDPYGPQACLRPAPCTDKAVLALPADVAGHEKDGLPPVRRPPVLYLDHCLPRLKGRGPSSPLDLHAAMPDILSGNARWGGDRGTGGKDPLTRAPATGRQPEAVRRRQPYGRRQRSKGPSPAKYGYTPKKRRALSPQSCQSSSGSMPRAAAIWRTVKTVKAGSLRLPRQGTGER